jgi:hypothetical protein
MLRTRTSIRRLPKAIQQKSWNLDCYFWNGFVADFSLTFDEEAFSGRETFEMNLVGFQSSSSCPMSYFDDGPLPFPVVSEEVYHTKRKRSVHAWMRKNLLLVTHLGANCFS